MSDEISLLLPENEDLRNRVRELEAEVARLRERMPKRIITERPPLVIHEEEKCSARIPLGTEVLVPTGAFTMGEGDTQRTVDVAEFYVDVYPYTNGQYEAFVRDTGHRPPPHWNGREVPPGLEEHPVVNVSYHDAQVCAEWRSEKEGRTYRLPTEEEWEKAARGTNGRTYPWGDDFEPGRCNTWETGKRGTTPVGSYPRGFSPYGCYDMSGNVWEWTESLYEKDKPYRVLRGGSWYNSPYYVRCATRYSTHPAFRYSNIGFRCARTP